MRKHPTRSAEGAGGTLARGRHPRPWTRVSERDGVLLVRSVTFMGTRKLCAAVAPSDWPPALGGAQPPERAQVALMSADYLAGAVAVLDAKDAAALAKALVRAGEALDQGKRSFTAQLAGGVSVAVKCPASDVLRGMVGDWVLVTDAVRGRSLALCRPDCDPVATALARCARRLSR